MQTCASCPPPSGWSDAAQRPHREVEINYSRQNQKTTRSTEFDRDRLGRARRGARAGGAGLVGGEGRAVVVAAQDGQADAAQGGQAVSQLLNKQCGSHEWDGEAAGVGWR